MELPLAGHIPPRSSQSFVLQIAATLPPVAIARLAASCRRMRMGSNQMWKAVCERFGFGFFRAGHFLQFGATKARERKWMKVFSCVCARTLPPSLSPFLLFHSFSCPIHIFLIYAQVLLDYLCTECNQPSRFYIKVDLNGGQVCRLNVCFREMVLDIC